MREKNEILTYLQVHKISYYYKEHEPAETFEQNQENVQGFGVSYIFCKNILLSTRKKTEFYLLLLPYLKRFETSHASRAIGTSRLSLAPKELLWEYLRCSPGSASGLGLIFDKGNVKLVADRELLSSPYICFHPNDNRATVCMKTKHFFKDFAPSTGHLPLYI